MRTSMATASMPGLLRDHALDHVPDHVPVRARRRIELAKLW